MRGLTTTFIFASVIVTSAPVYAQENSTVTIPKESKYYCVYNDHVYSVGAQICMRPGIEGECTYTSPQDGTAWKGAGDQSCK